ncbi:helix-turn-helix domain-containing protein [Streptomyces sp. ITFR-16]|uniref:helix-turn-helix domain-containing protein n=1 Tax=Streptomyces sp. ITFR-16 TaxID=3075198 RepID=UPI00288BA7E7|nr:helix-turn-helix domain-containing protein [Streptomyces sp. ITFR-16]WNI21897.1 helix-turn-helix domain-containing protein [Streptomyces sp. ITFR-16]
MHVEHLLQLESLDLGLLWGDERLLSREISGVTATDLEDPARFLQRGEVVLSGLVWWDPADDPAKVDRFVSALQSAGAAALLAGEETHGGVPDVLVDACRARQVTLISVPAQTSFRAVTDAVYLRQWGDLSRRPTDHYALPENVRNELSALVGGGAGPDTLLDRAFAHLGTPAAYLLSSTGRTLARTASAPPLTARQGARCLRRSTGATLRVEAEGSPYAARHLHLPDIAGAPPRVLHELADVLARHRQGTARDEEAARLRARALVSLMESPASDGGSLGPALSVCGLPGRGPYEVVAARLGGDEDAGTAADALAEALHHGSRPFAVAALDGGEAVAVVQGDAGPQALSALWPVLHACHPGAALHGGAGAAVRDPEGLRAGLVQARYALAAAGTEAPSAARFTSMDDLTGLRALLAGLPRDVREVYSSRALGPLLDGKDASRRTLLETLEVFLAHSGSWARTAEALHLHVNTVHYRVGRIELLTGRDLSRLDHRLDLQAALLCR